MSNSSKQDGGGAAPGSTTAKASSTDARPSPGEGEEGAAAVKSLENLQVALANIRARYQPLLNKDWEGVLTSLRPEEKAKLCVALAYSVHSLYYMLLRTKGVSPKTHAVRQELEKVQGYMKRVLAATKPQQSSEQATSKRTMVVDTAASRRMVTAALSGEGPGETEATTTTPPKRPRGPDEDDRVGDSVGPSRGERGVDASNKRLKMTKK